MSKEDKFNGMITCSGYGKYYSGTSGFPTVRTDTYILEGTHHSREDIKGLKEFEVESISAGEKFYVPLPWQLGGDMNEQKFLIGTALKDIPATKVVRKSYITGKVDDINTEPGHNITRTQTLMWHDARKDIPEMNRVCLIKVPGRPWNFSGKGDIKQDVVFLDSRQVFNEGELPYVFHQFGPGTFEYDEVTEWAYLDELE